MSNAITIAGDFAVSRTSKTGKTAYRGALGVITSGNATERAQLANVALGAMIAHNNFRGLVRELLRVFPLKALKNCPGVIFTSGGKAGVDHIQFGEKVDGRWTYDDFDANNPNKNTTHAYARAVIHVATLAAAADKAFKGEKATYAGLLISMIDAETQRIATEGAPEIEPATETVEVVSAE